MAALIQAGQILGIVLAYLFAVGWTFHDTTVRDSNRRIFWTGIVAVFFVPGFIAYLLARLPWAVRYAGREGA
jgi:putative flippase GtrA